MHRMTLGQVLVAFDAMSAYVQMTNPWGGGDGESSARRDDSSTSTLSTDAAMDDQFVQRNGGMVMNRTVEQLPLATRAALGL